MASGEYYKVHVLQDGTAAYVLIPGIPNDQDGDRPDIWAVQRTLFRLRLHIWSQMDRRLHEELLPMGGSVFIRSMMVFYQPLPQSATMSSSQMSPGTDLGDIEVRMKPVHLGRTSLSFEIVGNRIGSHDIFMKQVVTYVSVNMKTKQRMNMPQTIRWKYLKHHPSLIDNQMIASHVENVDKNGAKMIFQKQYVVNHEDIDHNGHTNVNVYQAICEETFKEGLKSTGLSGDISSQYFNFKGESFLEDTLSIQLGHFSQNKYVVRVVKGEKVIHECFCNCQPASTGGPNAQL